MRTSATTCPGAALTDELVREVVMRWRGKQAQVMHAVEREVCVEGAIRAGKTTVCLWKEHRYANEYPGIATLLARWTDDAVFGLIVPLWNAICAASGIVQAWNSHEGRYEWPNGSMIYIRGLKTQDQSMRYSKLRGYTIARAYVDQAEELPHDIYLELAGRLSQKGYPHQITISPQAIDDGHWIAKEFPVTARDVNRRYLSLSVYDNAHNLDPAVIPNLERLYPANHPKHKTLIRGERGMNVVGEPVYGGSFVRALHEREDVAYDPRLPLDLALDFGKHHPCLVARQTSVLGQRRFLGGIMGRDLYLGDFIDIARRHLTAWFPDPVEERWCCDPAGASDTSHGTEGAVKLLIAKGIHARAKPESNSPAVRLAVVERMAEAMRKRTANREECFVIAKGERWLTIAAQSTLVDPFLADGFEAGYVWDEHLISVANKQVRKPKKDGWYEHGQNCAEYLELNFGDAAPKKKREPARYTPMPTSDAGWMAG